MYKYVAQAFILSIFSTSVLSSSFEVATNEYPVRIASSCYYTPNFIDKIPGLIGDHVPEFYNGNTLQDTSRVVNGWAPAWSSCGYLNYTGETVDYANHIPKVSLSVSQDTSWNGGQTRVHITANATDYEDNSFRYEWKVNGVVQSKTSRTFIHTGYEGSNVNFSVTVWDSGIKVYNSSEKYWYNAGYPTFEQNAATSKSVKVLPWQGCGRDCIIH